MLRALYLVLVHAASKKCLAGALCGPLSYWVRVEKGGIGFVWQLLYVSRPAFLSSDQ